MRVNGLGGWVVIRPTTTSGLCRWYSSVESTTAGRVFVNWAPGNGPRQYHPASTIFLLLIFETLDCRRCRFGEIFIGPRV